MTQPQPFKICPQCQQPTPINTILCPTCGRRFQSTAPPVNQTQVFTSGGIPPTQPLYPQTPFAPAPPQVGGPRDQVEWMSSCIWTWIGLFFVATSLSFGIRTMFDKTMSDSTHGIALLICLILGSICTALIHRLRRLYIYFAFRRYRWWVPAIIVTGLIGLMLYADNERRSEAYRRAEGYSVPPVPTARTPEYYPPNPAEESISEPPAVTYPSPPPSSTNRLPGVTGYSRSYNNASSLGNGLTSEGVGSRSRNSSRPRENSSGFRGFSGAGGSGRGNGAGFGGGGR